MKEYTLRKEKVKLFLVTDYTEVYTKNLSKYTDL